MNGVVINGVEFTEITYRYDGDNLRGLLVHDIRDVNRDGDMIVGNGCVLPETEREADFILTNEAGETAFHMDGDVYVID